MHVADVMDDICQRGDWRRVHRLYSQLSAIAEDERLDGYDLSNEIPSALAEALGRTFASYENNEEKFIDDLLLLCAVIEQRDPSDPATFRELYFDVRLNRFDGYKLRVGGRRKPKPFEAAVETVRRIRDLNQIQEVFESGEVLETSAILGGSLSYGRFYNTCGGAGKPSDIDLLLLVRNYEEVSGLADRLSCLDFVDSRSVYELRRRSELFLSYLGHYEPCVFGHKVRLWEDEPHEYTVKYQVTAGHYFLGLHVVSAQDFDYLTLRDVPILGDKSTPDLHRRVFEYRDDPPRRTADEQRSFAGNSRTSSVPVEAVEEGWVTDSLVCEITENQFFPGVHLNLVLPRFEVRWESPLMRIRLKLLNFQWKLLARLEEEKANHGGHVCLSQSHTRSSLFSPHVTRTLDSW
jgi:hypothetical protein